MNERMIDKHFSDKGYTERQVEEIKMNVDKRTAVNFRKGLDEIEVCSDRDGEDMTITVRIDEYKVVKGSYRWNADSDLDYLGYEELDYTVMKVTTFNHEGDEMEIPESVLTPQDHERIEQAIRDHCEGN
jgi:hypothetical protein